MNRGTIVALSAVGLTLGASAVYYWDPKAGAKRRRLLRDRAVVIKYEARRRGRNAVKSVRTTTNGMVEAASGTFNRRELEPDELARRIASKVPKLVTYPGVRVEVKNGTVALSGPVLAEELEGLLSKVNTMAGARKVVSNLDLVIRVKDVRRPEDGNGDMRLQEVEPNHPTERGFWSGERVLTGAGSTLGLLSLGLLTTRLIAGGRA
jgi:hypothetical protein